MLLLELDLYTRLRGQVIREPLNKPAEAGIAVPLGILHGSISAGCAGVLEAL